MVLLQYCVNNTTSPYETPGIALDYSGPSILGEIYVKIHVN